MGVTSYWAPSPSQTQSEPQSHLRWCQSHREPYKVPRCVPQALTIVHNSLAHSSQWAACSAPSRIQNHSVTGGHPLLLCHPWAGLFPLWAVESPSEPKQPPRMFTRPSCSKGPKYSHMKPQPQTRSLWLLIQQDSGQGNHRRNASSNWAFLRVKGLLLTTKCEPGQPWAN